METYNELQGIINGLDDVGTARQDSHESQSGITEKKNFDREATPEEKRAIQPPNIRRLLTRKEVAEILQIGVSTLDLHVSREELPRIKMNHSVRFSPDDLEKYIQRCREKDIDIQENLSQPELFETAQVESEQPVSEG